MTKLCIAQININSVRNKISEVKLILESYEREKTLLILLINDTRLCDRDILNFEGHYLLRRDHRQNNHFAGGVAAVIPNQIASNKLDDFSQLEIETLGFEVNFGGEVIRIITTYPHPGQELPIEFFNLTTMQLNGNFCCVIGDFNAKLGLMGEGTSPSRAGERLIENFAERRFHVVNDDRPTYFSASNADYCEALDVCFVNKGASRLFHNWTTAEATTSDHDLTCLELTTNRGINEEDQMVVNYGALKEELTNVVWPSLNHISIAEIDGVIIKTEQIFNTCLDRVTTVRKKRPRRCIQISNQTSNWIKLRRKLCKICKRTIDFNIKEYTRRIINRCGKLIRKCLKEDSEQQDTIFAENLTKEPDTATRWRLFDKYRKSCEESTLNSGLYNENGEIKLDNSDIAEIHATRLEKTHSDPNDPSFNQAWREAVDREVGTRREELSPTAEPDEEVFDNPVTPGELIPLLRKMKNKSAPGRDKITNKMMKMAGPKFVNHVCFLFTILLSLGYFPKCWKVGIVTMIQKKGKNWKYSKNWRPITLLSCLSKLYESVILERFRRAKQQSGRNNLYQAGYEKGRSCQEQLLRLTEEVYHAFKKRLCVFAVFLDVEAAFDAVWVNGIFFKLLFFQMPNYLRRSIADFLRDRRLVVRVNGSYSREIKMTAGTPQGAVLSPDIFKLFTDDLPLAIPDPVSKSQFADDVGLWNVGSCKRDAAIGMQAALDSLSDWCNQWRTKLSAAKSVSTLFTKCPRRHKDENVKLSINGQDIQEKSDAKFLGVTFNCSMRWDKYLADLKNGVKFKINMLRSLSQRAGMTKNAFMVKMFDTLVTPVFEFGSPCYLPISQTHWEGLKTFHAQSLRQILHIPRHISYELIRDGTFSDDYQVTLTKSAKKRINGILDTSPFAADLISAAVDANRTRNLTPIQILIDNPPPLNSPL